MKTAYWTSLYLMIILLLMSCQQQSSNKNHQQERNAQRIDSLFKSLPPGQTSVQDEHDLPVTNRTREGDIVQKPVQIPSGNELPRMKKLREEIEFQIQRYRCTDPDDWKISPMGAKACGGPAFYIAYPIVAEYRIIDKIHEYTRLQAEYNRVNNIMSDCAMVTPPSSLKCVNEEITMQYDQLNLK